MEIVWIKSGVTGSTKPFNQKTMPGGLNLNKFIKNIAEELNVAVYESSTDSAGTTKPTRFNETTNKIEYFDGTDWSNLEVSVPSATAKNVTASASATELAGGLITSTSAAAVALTLPTATLLATELGAARGSMFEFVVDNVSGANTVTVTVNTGITAIAAVVTGGATLTVASGTVGVFRLIFTSATAAMIARVA